MPAHSPNDLSFLFSWENLERARRIERPTLTLARLCSTPELRPQSKWRAVMTNRLWKVKCRTGPCVLKKSRYFNASQGFSPRRRVRGVNAHLLAVFPSADDRLGRGQG